MSALPAWLRPAALAFAVIAALLLAASAPAISGLRYPDPDDVLRMVQVRDLLAGQGWFDLHQYRLDAPHGGVPMHWSRLVDVPLAAPMLVLTPLLGAGLAEIVTAVVVPLLTLACALALVARLAARTAGAQTALCACLALALSVPVLGQVLPLRVDHHGWQIVLALAALAGVQAADTRRGGWIAGLALAAWLAISLEALPMVAAFAAVLALRWWRDAGQRVWLVHLLLALATGSVALFLATRGLADLADHCDALSPVHLAVIGWGAVGMAVLARANPGRPLLVAGMAAIGAIGAGILYKVAPTCLRGGFAGMDPLVEAFWYRGIAEGQPLWQQPVAAIAQSLAPPLLGLAGLALLWRAEPERRGWWLDHALLLGAATAVALMVTRAGAVAGAFAAVPFGYLLQRALTGLTTARPVVRLGVLAAVVGLALVLLLPRQGTVPAPDPNLHRASTCRIDLAAATLIRLPKGEILAPMDIGPRLLHDTPHSVIASAHHRGEKGMHFAIAMFLGSPQAAQTDLQERGTAYVALCPGSNESLRFRAAAPRGLLAQLDSGPAPDWLTPVPLPAESNLKLWRIAP